MKTLSEQLGIDCQQLTDKIFPILQANNQPPHVKVLSMVRSGKLSEKETALLVTVGIDTIFYSVKTAIDKIGGYHNG
jgi:hypothetical protein